MPFLCFVRYIYPRNNVHISLGAGEILTFWHHMKLTIPAELWGQITHILVYLWGILLDGGMTEKEIKSLCCLSTFAWTFPATSAAHFLAFAFLATTFWSKECVMTGLEGLMSSGSVTDVTGTLFRMRSTFCWTVRMNIWSDFARTQQQLIFLPQFEDGPARLRTFRNQPDTFDVASFVAECLALFPWFFIAFFGLVTGLFTSFRSDAHQRHI